MPRSADPLASILRFGVELGLEFTPGAMSDVLGGKTPGDHIGPASGEERSSDAGRRESHPDLSAQDGARAEESKEPEPEPGPDAEQGPKQKQDQEQEGGEGRSQSNQKTDGETSSVVTQSSQNAAPEIRIPRGRGRPPRNANRTDIGPSGLVSITSIWADDDKPKGKRGRPRLRPLEPEKTEPEPAPNKPLKVKRPKGPKDILHDIIHRLYKRDKQQIFAEPVNAEFVPDYYQVIKNPMDFSTMRKKVSQDEYKDFDSFADDIKLIITNCYTYNKIGTMVYRMGLILEETWDKSLEGSRTRYEQSIKNIEEYEEKKRAGEIISDSEAESRPAWNQTPTSPTMESPNPSNQRSMITRRMEARLSGSQSPWVAKGPGIGATGVHEKDQGPGTDFMSRRALGGHPFGGTMMHRAGESGRNPYSAVVHAQGHQNAKSKGPTLADVCRGGVASIKENLERLKVDRFEPFSSLIRQLATQPCIRTPTVDDWYVFDKQLSEIQYRSSVRRFIGEDSIQALKKIMDIETALLEIDPHPCISKIPLSDVRLFGIDTDDFAAFNQNLSADGSFLLGVGENHVKVALTLQDEVPSLNLSAIRELLSKYSQIPPPASSQAKPVQGPFPNSSGPPGVGSGHVSFNKPQLAHAQTGESKQPELHHQRPAMANLESKSQDHKSLLYNRFGGQGEMLAGGVGVGGGGGGSAETPGSHVPHSQGRIAYNHVYSVGSGSMGGSYYESCTPSKIQKFDPPHYPPHTFPSSHSALPPHTPNSVSHMQPVGGAHSASFSQPGIQTQTPISGSGGQGGVSGGPVGFGQTHGLGVKHGGRVYAQGHGHHMQSGAVTTNSAGSNHIAPSGAASNAGSDVGASSSTSSSAVNGSHLSAGFNSTSNAATTNASAVTNVAPVATSPAASMNDSMTASTTPNAQYLNSNEIRRLPENLNYGQNVMGGSHPVHRQGHPNLSRTQSGNPNNHYLNMNTCQGGPGMLTGISQQRMDHTAVGQQKTTAGGYIPNEYMSRGADSGINVGAGSGNSGSNNGNIDNRYGMYQNHVKKQDLYIEMNREDRPRIDKNMYMVEGVGAGVGGISNANMMSHQQMLQTQSSQSSVQPPKYHNYHHPAQSQAPMHKQAAPHTGVGGNKFYPKYNSSHVSSNNSIHLHNMSGPGIQNPVNNVSSGNSQFPQDGGIHPFMQKKSN